jgi:tetratricopeptide (TPR) repeat protein
MGAPDRSQMDPKNILIEAQQAEERGLHREASALYAEAAQGMRREKRPRDAKSLLKKAVELSPQSGRLYVQLALVENALGNDEGALRAMEKFTETALQRGKAAEYRPYLEKHLAKLPTLRQVFYRGLLKLDRTDAGPFLDYAQAAIDKSDWEDAREMLVDALKTKSRTSEVVEKLKAALKALGVESAERALESFEAGRMPLKDLIAVLGEKKKPKRDSGTEPDALEREPEDETLDSLIQRLEGEMGIEIQERHDNVRPLVNEFRRRSDKVLQGDPKTRIDLAMAFFDMGLVEDARSELAAVKPSDGQYREAQMLTGEIYFQEGSFLEALDVFQRCLRDEGASADLKTEATYKLAQTYERLGDHEKALKWAERLEQRSPTYRDIRQMKRQLEERVKGKAPK